MRAIDADAFKDYIRGACEDMKHLYKDNGAWAKEITESFCKDIDEQPTIQPEILACGEGELNVQPEIIYCKDCSKHNVTISKAPYPFKEYICPLLAFRGEAQGHEFDYQFCAYGKKREVTE